MLRVIFPTKIKVYYTSQQDHVTVTHWCPLTIMASGTEIAVYYHVGAKIE
jgi:hypothetical protein